MDISRRSLVGITGMTALTGLGLVSQAQAAESDETDYLAKLYGLWTADEPVAAYNAGLLYSFALLPGGMGVFPVRNSEESQMMDKLTFNWSASKELLYLGPTSLISKGDLYQYWITGDDKITLMRLEGHFTRASVPENSSISFKRNAPRFTFTRRNS